MSAVSYIESSVVCCRGGNRPRVTARRSAGPAASGGSGGGRGLREARPEAVARVHVDGNRGDGPVAEAAGELAAERVRVEADDGERSRGAGASQGAEPGVRDLRDAQPAP